MTKLLDQAIDVAHQLPSDSQDDIARAVLALAGDEPDPIPLSGEERMKCADSA